MDKRTLLIAGFVLAGAAPFAAHAESTTATIVGAPVVSAPATPGLVVVQVEPPAPRIETAPAAREGYVWAPGYWSWDGSNYVWVEGRYVPALAGYTYVAPHWEAVNGGWVLIGEQWQPGNVRTNPLGNATANPLRPSPGQ